MLGAIIGDIAGSFREFSRNKFSDLPLIPSHDQIPVQPYDKKVPIYGVTDDSILTIASADTLLHRMNDPFNEHLFETYYRNYGLKYRYPIGGFGGGFISWLENPSPKPYHSCGNGSAMRISPVGYYGSTLEEVLDVAFESAACTHNHPEGIKGAQATAVMIYYARKGMALPSIMKELDELYLSYEPCESFDHFDAICPETMRLVMHCLLTTDNFHDAVFKAVTIPHGDSDTLGAIVGSIAEPLYGIPQTIIDKALPFIKPEFLDIYNKFKNAYINTK